MATAVNPECYREVLPQAIKLDPTLDEAQVTVAMTRLNAFWGQLFPAEQTRIVRLLVGKVIVSPNDLEMRLRANDIERLVMELRPESVEQTKEALTWVTSASRRPASRTFSRRATAG